MEDYFRAKRLLFESWRREAAVVNVDDPYGRRLAGGVRLPDLLGRGRRGRLPRRATSASTPPAPASRVGAGRRGRRSRPGCPGTSTSPTRSAALAAADALGVGLGEAATALARPSRVPGRFEPIDEGQPFAVLVDYAHTPDSLENVLRAARRLTEGRLISVFGAGGDRDRDKRPKMGRVGAELSDLAIVTSDNPRSEDPEAIIDEILAGIAASAGGSRSSRTAAPRSRSPSSAPSAGDTVVIAGKGHEQGQEFEGGRKIPFDDREVAREELRRLARRRVIELDAERIAGGRAPRSSPRAATGRRAGGDRLARGRRGGPLLRAARRARRRRRVRRGGARGRRLGRRSSRPSAAQRARRDGGWVFAADDPLAALQALAARVAARARRPRRRDHRLGRQDLGQGHRRGAAARRRVHASPENFNTEIGLPLTILDARRAPRCWCSRWRCAAPGQIAELAAIAEPDVAVITNVGPVHVELLGSSRRSPRRRPSPRRPAPRRDGGRPGRRRARSSRTSAARASCSASAPGGDVYARRARVAEAARPRRWSTTPAGEQRFRFPSPRPTTSTTPWRRSPPASRSASPLAEMADRAPGIGFSRLRGELSSCRDGIVLINDCYNANPVSMRAALDHLALARGRGPADRGARRDGASSGPDAAAYHREIGEHARARRRRAADRRRRARPATTSPTSWSPTPRRRPSCCAPQLGAGDAVLVKGSRAVGLERVAESLARRLDGRSPDRRHGGDADHDLPRARSSSSTCG